MLLLQSEADLLLTGLCLIRREPFPDSPLLQGLCIDDSIRLGQVPTADMDKVRGSDLQFFVRVPTILTRDRLCGVD